MNKSKYISLFILVVCLIPQWHFAQNPPQTQGFNKTPNDDLGDITDAYQEHFFEALKQRGIENYERSNQAFLRCLELNTSESVVYYELAKNYKALNKLKQAEDYLKTALSKQPNNRWYLDALYDVYYKLKDYDNALKTVKQLVQFHTDYKEDLASLYLKNRNYKEALTMLDELDKTIGTSKIRDAMRNEIYKATGADGDRIANLKARIKNNPSNEANYLNLIYRYSDQGKTEQAYTTAKQLLAKQPTSHLVHLALYKFYLNDAKPNDAISSMKIVMKSTSIKPDAKAKVLNDFVRFVKQNPQYEKDLLEVTTSVISDNTGKSNAELGQYYLQKGDSITALKNYELAYKKDNSNFDVIKQILSLQIHLEQYDKTISLSQEVLESYPSQPIVYLLNGIALNKLKRHNDAIAILEEGVDYIIDNQTMQIDFYKQLSLAYSNINNTNKAELFNKKARQLLKK